MIGRAAVAFAAICATQPLPAAAQNALDILHGGGRPATPPTFGQPPAAMPARPAPAPAPPAPAATLRPGDRAGANADQVAGLANLKFPGFVRALMAGGHGDVPDDSFSRKYVFSYLAVMAELCGPFSSGFSEVAIGFVEPRMGAGRNHAASGWSMANDWAKEFLDAYRSGNVFRMAEAYGSPKSLQGHVEEGVHDAAAILGQLGCDSPGASALKTRLQALVTERSGRDFGPKDDLKLAGLMSPGHRASKGIPDPGPELRRRLIDRAATQIRSQCVKRFVEEPFCDCVVAGLRARNVAEEDWDRIGGNFDQIVPVARDRPPVGQVVQACIRES